MPFHAGQTFHFPLKGGQQPHLWIIVTDPDGEGLFLIVSLTSLKGSKDQTVILRSGEHSFIKWDTCIAYGLSDLSTENKLQEFLDCGLARMDKQDLHPTLLKLVFDGFLASNFTKRRIADFVKMAKAGMAGS